MIIDACDDKSFCFLSNLFEGRRREEEELRRRNLKKKNKSRRHGPYEWKVAGFTPCSKSCGGGKGQTLIFVHLAFSHHTCQYFL